MYCQVMKNRVHKPHNSCWTHDFRLLGTQIGLWPIISLCNVFCQFFLKCFRFAFTLAIKLGSIFVKEALSLVEKHLTAL